MYALDTNAIVYYAQNEAQAVARIETLFASSVPIYVSAASVIEAFSPSFLPESERIAIEEILRGLTFVPVDMSIARQSAQLRSTHRLKLGDAMIAATALFTASTLVTRNIDDFKRVPGLSIEAI